jgi:hypothetical protein
LNDLYAIYNDAQPAAPPVAWIPDFQTARRVAAFLFGEDGRVEAQPNVAKAVLRATDQAFNGGTLTYEEAAALRAEG